MSELSQSDVIAVTGPIGDVPIAEIIGTGITKEELSAARDRVLKDRNGQDMGLELEPGHIAKVVRNPRAAARSRRPRRSRLDTRIVKTAAARIVPDRSGGSTTRFTGTIAYPNHRTARNDAKGRSRHSHRPNDTSITKSLPKRTVGVLPGVDAAVDVAG